MTDDVGLSIPVDSVLNRARNSQFQEAGVRFRLQRKFGLGDRPAIREALYHKLEKLVDLHGDNVLELISQAVAQSCGKRSPGRYFASAICKMLKDSGYSHNPGKDGKPLW